MDGNQFMEGKEICEDNPEIEEMTKLISEMLQTRHLWHECSDGQRRQRW